MRAISVEQRRARLARRHLLIPAARTDDVAAIADAVVGLHSSDPVSVYLSATARMSHPSLEAVERALYAERSVVRHHAMRRTLWVMTPEVAREAHAAATVGLQRTERKRTLGMLADNGIAEPEAWLTAAERDTVAALEELGEATARQLGIAVPSLTAPLQLAPGKAYAATQGAHTRVLLLLGFNGRIVRTKPAGSWIAGQYRYAPMERWLPGGVDGLDPAEAAGRIADRWLRRFGPATTDDLRWWMGWAVAKTGAALIRCGAEPVDLDGAPGWVAAGDADDATVSPWVALLPGLDPTTMGWKQRGWYLAPELAGQVFDHNGNGGPTVWADGRIVGGWVQRKDGEIAYRLLTDVGRAQERRIAAAAERVAELVGDVRFTVRFPAPLQRELLG